MQVKTTEFPASPGRILALTSETGAGSLFLYSWSDGQGGCGPNTLSEHSLLQECGAWQLCTGSEPLSLVQRTLRGRDVENTPVMVRDYGFRRAACVEEEAL